MAKYYYTLLGIFASLTLLAQNVVVVTDGDVGTGETVWTSDNEYHLDGYVFVPSGGVLRIEAGTVVRGLGSPSTGDASSALIVARGAQIFAEGTATRPIIFTAELDDISDPTDLTKDDKGLWGGLIVLGAATVGVDGGVQNVEGIPSTEGRAEYGGTNDDDNSGVIRYVSIRHGGSKLEANNEINGLTLAGVGRATQIDFIEIFANLDDGIEWFGGTVDVKHASVAFCGDDSFDYDQGWDGRGQFWFSIQDEISNRSGEWDGSEAADLQPKAIPVISNATFIGAGESTINDDNNDALRIRDDAACNVWNSIMIEHVRNAIVIDNDAAQDSWQRFLDGDIAFVNNIFFNFGAGNTFADITSVSGGTDKTPLVNHLSQNGNSIEDPVIGGITRTDMMLDPRLDAGSPALGGARLIEDDYFDPVPYRGAFNNRDNWLLHWTALDTNNYFGDLVTEATPDVVTVRDSDVNAGDDVRWTADKEYLLDGYIFVEEGATLTIDPGTVIKGKASPSTGDASSALIISRGGTIIADGTADFPIIFTAEFDDIDNPNDLTPNDKGLWGGLILLGEGVVGVDGGVQNIEGIPSTEGRAEYGGDNNDDNSGILRYVSIRHGGDKLEANNEINGLTLGGVGRGTVIDYVEVYANLDDGIEWFGGAADVKHAVVAFCGDDSFDYDQGWDGRGQFWFTLQDEISNRAGEWDGSEAADLQPKVSPVISNCTFIGAGPTTINDDNNDALRIRDDAAAMVYNSIMIDFARRAIVIDNDAAQDSWQRFLDGDLTFTNNLFFQFAAGNTFADITTVSGGTDNGPLVQHLNDNGNTIEDPLLGGISRMADGGLDPRIDNGSPALGGAELLSDDYFDPVPYRGAFPNDNNWAESWTALGQNGFFGDLVDPAEQNVVTVRDSDINAGENVTWTADNVYLLDGYVFVESGATLTINPGTIIKGKASPSTGDASSALIISRGGRIIADGTAELPIIFTAEFDDVENPDDLTPDDKGLWGGLILLGEGVVGVDGGVQNIEGIPSTEGRAEYGGNNNDDDSGILRYVSIRHGGDKLEANNEINGLTLGGVGRGTVIDYVEVYANLDDGIEWFGGAADVKHAVVAFCGDDSFDYDQSWDGRGQFWFTLQDEISNRAGEWDGSEAADLQPQVSPVISNCTFIGGGPTSINDDNNDALRIRDDAAAMVYNSIITDFARDAIVIDNDAAQDSWQRFLDGDLTFTNNLFFQFGGGSTFEEITVVTSGTDNGPLVDHLNDNGNAIEDPLLGGISRTNDGGLDPRIDAGSPALGGAELLSDDYFDPVPYRGAFPNDNNWAESWTALGQNGFFGDLVDPAEQNVIVVRDTDINAGDNETWTADNVYLLDGYVFVENGATLTINPGTVIKGKASPSTGDASSALIISRGGRIIADGRRDAPIIFTAEFDDVEDPNDLTKNDKGLWGGLILLGEGVVGVDGGVQNIEGIPSTEGRAEYGGNNNDDDSGILRYVSIRHGGDKLEANNEINGLTLGGVGRGTLIDYVEVYANLDDGIEWFGGAVDVKHAVVSFCGDDSYDYDQSWDGNGQFWFTLQDSISNRAGEWDGSEAADLQPQVSPVISNMTLIGAGDETINDDNNDALRIRDDAAAMVYNSIITEFVRNAIVIDNDAAQDSWQRFLDGDLTFTNNVFFNLGAGDTFADITSVTSNTDNAPLVQHLEDNGNVIDDPALAGISRIPNGGLDPRINGEGAAWNRWQEVPGGNDFFETVSYIGAFGSEDNWAEPWTALSSDGFFGDLVSAVDDPTLSELDERMQVFPNPVAQSATVQFETTRAQSLGIQVIDMTGRTVAVVAPQDFAAGVQTMEIDMSQMMTGAYLVAITDGASIVARRVVLKK